MKNFCSITSAIISTNNLSDAIAQAAPGDTFEIKAGTALKFHMVLKVVLTENQ